LSKPGTPDPGSVEVLLAEDSPTQAERLKYTLERHGYRVTSTINGRLALEAARARKPTLVISDVIMPEMNGYELCRSIKTDPALADVPVILVTTLADPQDVIRGLECRADNFIIKPYDERYLLSRIQFVLQNERIREPGPASAGVDIFFNGQQHTITADRLQILNLLLSTYEAAIQRNQELTATKDELRTANVSLESTNQELAQAIASERQSLVELKNAQGKLIQAEKLASLGQMVAGVAHEINNPLSFISNNMWVFQRDFQSLKQLVDMYRGEDKLILEQDQPASIKLKELSERMDLDYTLTNLNDLLGRSRDGLKRIEQIVQHLRDFARMDEGELQEADVNEGIQSAVSIIVGRAKIKQVTLDLHLSKLPPLACYPTKISQVVMSLISNAIDASQPGGVVTISSRTNGDAVEIEVADNGTGIDPAIRNRIFDPFFTTKAIGQGMGLGLSISYAIVDGHHGSITVDSTPGKGSRFIVRLPLATVPQAVKQ